LQRYDGQQWGTAVSLFEKMVLSDHLPEFLTTEAYPHIRAFVNAPIKAAL